MLRHIERVAEQVHRILSRPAEHPSVELADDDDLGGAADPEATEKLWDEFSKHNRRRQERMLRALEERRSRGLDEETAFRDALRDADPELPDDETARFDESQHDDEPPPFAEWLADEAAGEVTGFREADDDSSEAQEEERQPLLQKAMDLLERWDSLFRDAGPRWAPALGTLDPGAGAALGGLAQALSHRDHDAEDYGLRLVQLKRALRGAAFARGALFPLRSAIDAGQFDELFRTLQQDAIDFGFQGETMALPQVLGRVMQDPDRFFSPVEFDVAAALIPGFDLASNGGLRAGFREWLIVKLGRCARLRAPAGAGALSVLRDPWHAAGLAASGCRVAVFRLP